MQGFHDEPARRALQLREHISTFQRAIGAPERCPFPVIAAIHGVSFGLAVDMITACDIRLAAADTKLSIKVSRLRVRMPRETMKKITHGDADR